MRVSVIPAKAGIRHLPAQRPQTPAFAGMTQDSVFRVFKFLNMEASFELGTYFDYHQT